MENYMQKVMIKKCLVYILNNIFLFILLNCNSNNYLLSKYTLSTNLVLCEYSANGRPLVTVEKSTQYAKQVHLTKKLNTVGSPF